MLDVIEHFPPEELESWLRSILWQLPTVRLVVLKLPDSAGPLYRLASALAHTRTVGALEQLYQVGTWPPHLNYFSRDSLHRLLPRVGLRAFETWSDPDFEPATLVDRVQALRTAPRLVRRLVEAMSSAIQRVSPWKDSLIALCSVTEQAREQRIAVSKE